MDICNGKKLKTISPNITKKSTITRCFPQAIFLGFPKCGSSDLYARLTETKDIYPGSRKELNFWDKNRYGNKSCSITKKGKEALVLEVGLTGLHSTK